MQSQGLHNLVAPIGARKAPKRVGRGESSGHGKTSTRGAKGQKARKSGNVRPGFEGGQTPLSRRLPKRGFKNIHAKPEYRVVNLAVLSERFEKNADVTPATLMAAGLLSKVSDRVKVLANGEMTHALKLSVHAISEAAVKKVQEVGGTVELIGRS